MKYPLIAMNAAISNATHVRRHGWPKDIKFAAGVIDVKSPFVETPETVNASLHNLADIDGVGPERVLGGTAVASKHLQALGVCPGVLPFRS